MREMIRERIEGAIITVKPSAFILFLAFLFCFATLIIFRQQCVQEGYEISRLSGILDKKQLAYEKISADYYDVLSREKLINKAEEKGFVFPHGGKVFYVR